MIFDPLSLRFSLYLFLLHRLLDDKGCVNVNSFERFWVQINGFHMQPGDLSYFIQIIHYSPIDVLAIKDCDDPMDISIIPEKLRKLHLLWHP